jgi:hypothetical protein
VQAQGQGQGSTIRVDRAQQLHCRVDRHFGRPLSRTARIAHAVARPHRAHQKRRRTRRRREFMQHASPHGSQLSERRRRSGAIAIAELRSCAHGEGARVRLGEPVSEERQKRQQQLGELTTPNAERRALPRALEAEGQAMRARHGRRE